MLIGTHKVREAVEFSATLRCSGTPEEKDALVSETLHEMGLNKCAETLIGNVFIKGISGGEKKRTSIAIDLIADPAILFLDEPTTGLDSYKAEKLVHKLKKINAKGRTVVMTIHQPNSEIYKMLNRLILIVNGSIV